MPEPPLQDKIKECSHQSMNFILIVCEWDEQMAEGQLGILDHIKVCGVNQDYRRIISILTAYQMKHFKKEAPESPRGN